MIWRCWLIFSCSLLLSSTVFADYTIDYGDGTSETISAALWTGGSYPAIGTHSYTNNGLYLVTISGETDCDGDSLADATPLTSNILVNVGGVTQSLDYGDGTAPLTSALSPCATPLTPSHSYATPGSYLTTYRALDDDGNLITETIQIEVAGADHFSISHDGSGINCQAEPVTLAAHDASHQVVTGYTGTLNLTTSTGNGDWSLVTGVGGNFTNSGNGQSSYVFDGSENGLVVLGLKDTVAESVDINLTDSSAVEAATEDPALAFAATGFNFLADGVVNGFVAQTAGKASNVALGAQNIELQAITTSDSTGACEAALVGATAVDLAFECIDPLACNGDLLKINSVSVIGNNASASIVYSGVMLDFGNSADSTAATILNYADVGKIRLHARYQLPDSDGNPSGIFMAGSSGDLIFKPATFELTLYGNPAAADSSGGLFKKAGETFNVQIVVRGADGAVTPNYGQEISVETVGLLQTLIAPAGGVNLALSGSFNGFGTDCFSSAAPGYACGQFGWDEVGILELTPEIGDQDYLGAGNVTGSSSGHVGRFYAAKLSVTPNSPMLSDACTSGANNHTYVGQDFSFLIDPKLTIRALGVGGDILSNYDDQFWKLSAALSGRSYSNASAVSIAPSLTTAGATSLSGQGDFNGSADINIVADRIAFGKPVTAIGPFEGKVNLVLAATDLTDSDGAFYDADNDGNPDPYTLNDIGSTTQRYGRLVLQNTYGPELLGLSLPLSTEYYAGANYIINADDDCTSYDVVDFVLSNYQGNLTDGATTLAGMGVLVGGLGSNLTFSAPGAGKDGSVDYLFDLDAAGLSWLKESGANPTGKATFGIFKGNERLIYMRESYQ